MDVVANFEYRFGGRWCGISFERTENDRSSTSALSMPFCQAIGTPGRWPIVLNRALMDCPGGRRSFGWDDDDRAFAAALAEKSGLRAEIAQSIILQTPRLDHAVAAVTVGTRELAQIVLSYAQPEVAMRFLREWQSRHGTPLAMEVSAFMSVCGAVAVKAYLSGKACVSFGCPDARRHGCIGRDRLVIGLPVREAMELAGGIHG